MRAYLFLASIGLAMAAMSASPAAAFDDGHARRGAYRGHHYSAHAHCPRLFWRDRCGPYRLGGYFTRNPDFRRLYVFRKR
jgi:hypothetical protein